MKIFKISWQILLRLLKSLLNREPVKFAKWAAIILLSLSPIRLYSSVDIREDHPLYQAACLWMRAEWARIYKDRLSLASVQSLGPNAISDSSQQHQDLSSCTRIAYLVYIVGLLTPLAQPIWLFHSSFWALIHIA